MVPRRSWLPLVAMLVLCIAPAAARPARIMSLNLCTDQLVLALANPRDIAAVTWLSRDCQSSAMCEAAARVPITYGTAEELLATAPDLVVAGRYTARAAVGVARKGGLPVLDLPAATTLDQVRRQIREVAAAVEEPARGETMVATLDRGLDRFPVPEPGARRPLAVVYSANGATVGGGSLIDEVLRRAGFDNLARRLGIDNYPFLPLEALVAGNPDLLIMNNDQEARPALAKAVLRHPVLLENFAASRRVAIPHALWVCGGPPIIGAIERLVAARAALPPPAP